MTNLTAERIAEIKAFNGTDISDCPELTDEQLKKMKPRYPNSLKSSKEDIQIRLDADVIAWFKQYGENYQNQEPQSRALRYEQSLKANRF